MGETDIVRLRLGAPDYFASPSGVARVRSSQWWENWRIAQAEYDERVGHWPRYRTTETPLPGCRNDPFELGQVAVAILIELTPPVESDHQEELDPPNVNEEAA